MISTSFTAIAMVLLNLLGGVVMELETRDLRSKGEAAAEKVYVQELMLRMEARSSGENMTLIFRDNSMLILDHRKKSYQRIDETTMAQIGSQMSEAMKQMNAELAKLPPEQRAMMEKMMKGRMPPTMQPGGGMGAQARTARLEGNETVGRYACKKYGIYRGDEKIQEVYAARLSDLPELSEAMEAFRAMARFSKKLVESLPQGPFAGLIDNSFSSTDDIDGFPVLTRSFEGGRATSEVAFKSVRREDLSKDLFSVPAGYAQVDLMPQKRE